jgi:hypothetical protein
MLIAISWPQTQAPHNSAEGEMRGLAFLVIRLQALRLCHLPEVAGHSADPKVHLMCDRSIHTYIYPTVLVSRPTQIFPAARDQPSRTFRSLIFLAADPFCCLLSLGA